MLKAAPVSSMFELVVVYLGRPRRALITRLFLGMQERLHVLLLSRSFSVRLKVRTGLAMSQGTPNSMDTLESIGWHLGAGDQAKV